MFEGLLQPLHLLIVLIIALVIFGPGKLPELGSSLGKAIRGFKKSMQDTENELAVNETKKIEHKEAETKL
ncbi:MAG: twin-arginine translocase TatA/TatE family subunit [Syntrophales bacterium LBB04]|nr:twin-arginine translocase TatA/TatE family subunit [Syntrophales bacterium LBB04]